jgi:hypothetical protein
MDEPTLVPDRHENPEPMSVAEASDIEVLLHRVGRSEQPDRREAREPDGVGRGVSDMNERDPTADEIASDTLCMV